MAQKPEGAKPKSWRDQSADAAVRRHMRGECGKRAVRGRAFKEDVELLIQNAFLDGWKEGREDLVDEVKRLEK